MEFAYQNNHNSPIAQSKTTLCMEPNTINAFHVQKIAKLVRVQKKINV